LFETTCCHSMWDLLTHGLSNATQVAAFLDRHVQEKDEYGNLKGVIKFVIVGIP
jgi:hypothetical protein